MKYSSKRILLAILLFSSSILSAMSYEQKIAFKKTVSSVFIGATEIYFKKYTDDVTYSFESKEVQGQPYFKSIKERDEALKNPSTSTDRPTQFKYIFNKHVKGVTVFYFSLVFIVQENDELYVSYRSNKDFVHGRQTFDYNTPLQKWTEIVIKDDNDDEIEMISKQEKHEKMVNQFLKICITRALFQFFDKLAQSIETMADLKDLLETYQKATAPKNDNSPKKNGEIYIKTVGLEEAKSSFFDIEEMLFDLVLSDQLISKIFIDDALQAKKFYTTKEKKSSNILKNHTTNKKLESEDSDANNLGFFVDREDSHILLVDFESTKKLKQFGKVEGLFFLHPARQLISLKIKSKYFLIQHDFNMLTLPFIISGLTSFIQQIETDIFDNLLRLKQNTKEVFSMSDFVNYLNRLKFYDSSVEEKSKKELFNSDFPMFDSFQKLKTHSSKDKTFKCMVHEKLYVYVCFTDLSVKDPNGESKNIFEIIGLYTISMEGPVSSYLDGLDDEDKTFNSMTEHDIWEQTLKGKSSFLSGISEIKEQETFYLEQIQKNPYLFGPKERTSVYSWSFPASSMYSLNVFIEAVLKWLILMDKELIFDKDYETTKSKFSDFPMDFSSYYLASFIDSPGCVNVCHKLELKSDNVSYDVKLTDTDIENAYEYQFNYKLVETGEDEHQVTPVFQWISYKNPKENRRLEKTKAKKIVDLKLII